MQTYFWAPLGLKWAEGLSIVGTIDYRHQVSRKHHEHAYFRDGGPDHLHSSAIYMCF